MSCEIKFNDNGAIIVTGDFLLKDASGRVFGLGGRTTIGLCRCGNSSNKPFCDGTHNRSGFASCVESRDLPPPAQKR
jgi:CDGSH-type Zn-finger protein